MAWFGRPPPAFERLDARHAEACASVHAKAFAQGWSALDFERLIGAPSSLGDMALDARTGTLAGFVLSRGAAQEAEILTIAVAPAWRRRGIGGALMTRHIARVAREGIADLFLEVAESNQAARALYRGLAFREVGRRPGYYPAAPGAAPVSALILRRAIV